MKKSILFILYFISFSSLLNSQSKISNDIPIKYDSNKTTFGKFFITSSLENEKNTTINILENGAFIVFYTGDQNKDLYMANVWPKSGSQSYGKTYSYNTFDIEDPISGIVTTNTLFKWDYLNSYNSIKGSATVIVEQTNSQKPNTFKIIIITDKLNKLTYEGYKKEP